LSSVFPNSGGEKGINIQEAGTALKGLINILPHQPSDYAICSYAVIFFG